MSGLINGGWTCCRNSTSGAYGAISRSRTWGSSSNGVSPYPADGGIDIHEQVEKVMNDLRNVSDGPESDNNSRDYNLHLVKDNITQVGQILEKAGGAANGQIPGVADKAKGGSEMYQEIIHFLKGAGQVHWVAVGLLIVGFILDRFFKARKISEDLQRFKERFMDFGRLLRKISRQLGELESPESLETLRKAVRLLCECTTFSKKMSEKKASQFWRRFVCADTQNLKLASLNQEMDRLLSELNVNGVYDLHDRMNPRIPHGESFEISEVSSRDLVGNEERVREALREFRNHDSKEGARVLVVVGMAGIGSSTVGDHVAAALKRDKNYDNHNCCRISMRSEGKEIDVTKKQEDIYSRLVRGEKPVFSDPKEGKQKLEKLFHTKRKEQKPGLMYFDDVDKSNDLDRLLPDNLGNCLHPESILLVTTRNEMVISVLECKGVHRILYKVRELQPKDAKKLLLKKIFGGCDVPDNSPIAKELQWDQHFLKLLHDICEGVPLAINVVGSSIWIKGQAQLEKLGKSAVDGFSVETAYSLLSETDQAGFLETLKTAVNHAVTCLSAGDPINGESDNLDHCLDFAFKQLACNQSNMELFLDIVAVYSGMHWEDVKLICGPEHLENLKKLSMVNCVGSDSHAVVAVHPLLIGAAQRRGNTDSRFNRVLRVENVADKNNLPRCFQDDGNADEYKLLEVLKTDNCEVPLSARRLDLVIRNVRHYECYRTNIIDKCKTVPRSLRYLRSRQSHVPFNLLQLKMLVILDLDVRMDTTTLTLESLHSMPELQKLKLKNSTSVRVLGPKLPKLRVLGISNCPNFEHIEGLDGTKVQEIRIVRCPKFVDFRWIAGLSCLERLSLSSFDFTRFPQELVIPSRVQVMDLSRNPHLEVLPTVASKHIKKLILRQCPHLREVNAVMIASSSLEYLDLGGCAALKELPSLAPTLKVVDVHGCDELDPTKLQESYELKKSRNPKFQMIGFRSNREDEMSGGCSIFRKCFLKRWSLGKTQKRPNRSLKVSSTFPQRKNEKLEFKDRLGDWIREAREKTKFWEISNKLYECLYDSENTD